MNRHRVLIVDDEPDLCELLSITLSRMQLASDSVYTLKDAKSALQKNSYLSHLSEFNQLDASRPRLCKNPKYFH